MSCADKHKTIAMIYSQHIADLQSALSKQVEWFGKVSGGSKVGKSGGEAPQKF